jgi:hypothetical protein
VDHAFGVGITQCLEHLDGDVRRLLRRQTPGFAQPRGEGAALDVLEHEVGHARILARVVEGDDAGVSELADDPGLLQQRIDAPRLLGRVAAVEPDSLDRHAPVQARVFGEVDLALGAAPEALADLESAQTGRLCLAQHALGMVFGCGWPGRSVQLPGRGGVSF